MIVGWLARSLIMGEGVVVRPDQVSLEVLVAAVSRDAVDGAVATCGVGRGGVGMRRRSGSRSAASAAWVINAVSAYWTSSHAQISWWTSSGSRERRIFPGPRRWVLS